MTLPRAARFFLLFYAHRHETKYLDNLDLANRRSLVLSWSRWGTKKSGHGHVNPKTPQHVQSLFKRRGYRFDANATLTLRKCASFSYLRQTKHLGLHTRVDPQHAVAPHIPVRA